METRGVQVNLYQIGKDREYCNVNVMAGDTSGTFHYDDWDFSKGHKDGKSEEGNWDVYSKIYEKICRVSINMYLRMSPISAKFRRPKVPELGRVTPTRTPEIGCPMNHPARSRWQCLQRRRREKTVAFSARQLGDLLQQELRGSDRG